jgi:hypothetical protein
LITNDIYAVNNKAIRIDANNHTNLIFGNFNDGAFAYGGTYNLNIAVEGDVKASRFCIGDADCVAGWSDLVEAGGGGQWVTSGTNIYNANTGNVGVGTGSSNISNKFTVQGISSGTGFSGSDGTGGIRVRWATGYGVSLDAWDGGTPRWGITKFSAGTPKVMIEGRHNSNDVIFNAGNVGIGITIPAARLQVNPSTNNEGIRIISSNYSPFIVRNSADTADFFRVKEDGKVGIGTHNPTLASLQIQPPSTGDAALALRPRTGLSGYTLLFTLDDTGARIQANSASRDLILGANNLTNQLVLKPNGRIGIGTTDPGSYKLYVDGNQHITGDLSIGGNFSVTGADLAEEFSSEEYLEPGTVVVMGDNGYRSTKASEIPYDGTVLGAISTKPALVLGSAEGEYKAIIAFIGVVPVKVTNINGKIQKGDLLVSSSVKGYAMKAQEAIIGTIIGKALEDFDEEFGIINVLINLK